MRRSSVITIFGSSSPVEGQRAYELAYELGYLLGSSGYDIANGGYGGTMEATARGAKKTGSTTIGITCEAFGQAAPNKWIDRQIRTSTLYGRLERLIDLGQAYVVLPGGTGTLLEFAMAWELVNKRFLPDRTIFCLTDFWRPVYEIISGSGETCRATIRFVESPERLISYLLG